MKRGNCRIEYIQCTKESINEDKKIVNKNRIRDLNKRINITYRFKIISGTLFTIQAPAAIINVLHNRVYTELVYIM